MQRGVNDNQCISYENNQICSTLCVFDFYAKVLNIKLNVTSYVPSILKY
jgi:hypothetical protein